MRPNYPKENTMFKKLDGEDKYALAMGVAMIPAIPVGLATIAAKRAKKFAQDHPVATSVAAGIVGSVAVAAVLVDGDDVADDSLYAKTKNKITK